MDDVVVAGAGPAGSIAALVLARAKVRVRLIDRARFPRPKLCGDTVNPGALAVLARHLDVAPLLGRSDPVDGMILTGPGGVRVRGTYGDDVYGRAITRSELDAWLLREATRAGAVLEEGVSVAGPLAAAERSGQVVAGVDVRVGRVAAVRPARMVIAADGRTSRLAGALGLGRVPRSPRRWAIGAYYDGVDGLTRAGEMHVRAGHYLGVAPLPGGVANACLVLPAGPGGDAWRDPGSLLDAAVRSDPQLGPRFASARAASKAAVLGPMAYDVPRPGVPGLLLAGDAAGFIDPMTGDGLRFALAGGELAAAVTLDVLGGRLTPGQALEALAARRRATFGAKWRFNRVLRRLVASPAGVGGAAAVARVLPGVFERVIRYAGDVEVDH